MFFISSSIADDELQFVRKRFHSWAHTQGIPHWMFEHERPRDEWDATPLSSSTAICLSTLSECHTYVGIFHNSYGSTAASHVARIALTELELFYAIRLRKRLLLYVIDSSGRDENTESLLTLIQHIAPTSIRGIGTKYEVLAWMKRDVLSAFKPGRRRDRVSFGKYLDVTARYHWQQVTSRNGQLMLPLSNARTTDIDGETASRLIASMSSLSTDAVPMEKDHDNLLSRLLPHIFALSLSDTPCDHSLQIIDAFCTHWHAATVWRHNHHFGQLGCLAVTNTQLIARCMQAIGDEAVIVDRLEAMEHNIGLGSFEWTRVYALGGQLASSYYSLGKQHRWSLERRFLLTQAKRWIGVARKVERLIDGPESFAANLAAIAGHIHLASNDLAQAETEFRQSLAYRTGTASDPGNVAEAQADLGYVLAIKDRNSTGLRMVEDATATLCSTKRAGFTARIKLKLAELYLRSMRIGDAIKEVSEADAICRHHGIALRTSATAKRRLVLGALRVMARPIVAVESEQGYVFVPH